MLDEKTNRVPQHPSRVNLSEDYEVRYWSHMLGVTEKGLRAAVERVGSNADAVRRELGGR